MRGTNARLAVEIVVGEPALGAGLDPGPALGHEPDSPFEDLRQLREGGERTGIAGVSRASSKLPSRSVSGTLGL